MKVLLIWNQIPEDCQFYAIEDPTKEQLDVLAAAHSYIINHDMPPEAQVAADKLNIALCAEAEYLGDDEKDSPWALIWKDKQVETGDLTVAGPFDQVFYSGFAM